MKKANRNIANRGDGLVNVLGQSQQRRALVEGIEVGIVAELIREGNDGRIGVDETVGCLVGLEGQAGANRHGIDITRIVDRS